MNLTGGGPDTFGAISTEHMVRIAKHVGFRADQNVVEIGCGIGRDAIPLTKILNQSAGYIRIDITRSSIEWRNVNIARKHPNFRFCRYNVADQIRNLSGSLSISDCRISADARSIDLKIAQSVLTRIFEDGIKHYLGEGTRILKKDGVIYATCFIVGHSMRDALRDKPAASFGLGFRRSHGSVCFINVLGNPTAAVAYTLPKLESMVASAGLAFQRPLLRGH